MDFLKTKLGQAVDHLPEPVRLKLLELEREKDALVNRVQQQAIEFRDEKARMLDEFAEEKKNMLLRGFLDKYNSIFDYIMNMVLMTLKDKADDKYMPRFVKAWIDTILDALWPDVKDEVKTAIVSNFVGPDAIHHGSGICCGRANPLAFLRYNLFPYDRNIWRQIRNPIWYLCSLASVVPVYAISQIYYFCVFFLIDKSDEFQLFQFIAEFKSFQFASLGIVSAIYGSVQYYVCTSMEPSNCREYAPKVQGWVMIVFACQILFVWSAFLLLRCSERKGGLYYQTSRLDEAALATKAQRREGFAHALRGEVVTTICTDQEQFDNDIEETCRWRLTKLLIYDLVIFVLCCALIVFTSYANFLDRSARVNNNSEGATDGNWKYVATLFWIRAFYGFMSFPFVLLKIPGISTVFSHAKPTGYNPWGKTCPWLGEEEDGPVPWDLDRPYQDPDKQAKALKKRAGEPVQTV